jgi:BirA family biotin operon repressor/biotin-[acetyl-CoA-carboxylase] ligase
MLRQFAVEGFAPFQAAWRGLDTLANAPIKVINGTQTTLGIARGVDSDGTLLVDVDGQVRKFASGEVSVRSLEGR